MKLSLQKFLDNVQAKPWCTELFITKQHSLEWFLVYKPDILELAQISNHTVLCATHNEEILMADFD